MAWVSLMCWMVFAGFFLFMLALILLRLGVQLKKKALTIGSCVVVAISVAAIVIGGIALSDATACDNCGGSISVEDAYCGSCGMDLRLSDKEPEVTICLNCGTQGDTAYCKKCGEHLAPGP